MSAALDADRVQQGVTGVQARIANLVRSLGETKTIQLALPEQESWKLLWFDAGTLRGQPARPTLGIGDAEREAAAAAIQGRVTLDPDGRLNTLVALTDAGRAIARVYAARLASGGADRAWSPLAPAYAAWKAKRGYPTHPGVATGELVAQLQRCFVIVRNT